MKAGLGHSLDKCPGVDRDRRIGVEMDRDCDRRSQQANRFDRVLDAHRKVVSYRQQCDVDGMPSANQFHVAEESRVAGVVDRPPADKEEHSRRVSHRNTIGRRRAVKCDGELDPAECNVGPPAYTHPHRPASQFLEIPGELERCDHQRVCAAGDRHRIAKVIAMSVCDNNKAGRELIGTNAGPSGQGIVRDMGIYEDVGAAVSDKKGRMAKEGKGDFRHHGPK